MNCDSGEEQKNSFIAEDIGLMLIRVCGVSVFTSCVWMFILSRIPLSILA